MASLSRHRERAAGEVAAPSGGTRPRVIAALAVGLTALTVLYQLVSTGAMGVNFTTTDKSFQIYSNYVQGVEGAGFLDATTKASATQSGVAEIGFAQAQLAGLCLITYVDPTPTNQLTLMLTAGDPVLDHFDDSQVPAGVQLDDDGLLTGDSLINSIHAEDLLLNSDAISGYGNKLNGLNLGQDASTVGTSAGIDWPTGNGGSSPASGDFGLYAHHLNIANLDGATYGVNLKGSINLKGLRVRVLPGHKTQADCPIQAAN